MEKDEETPPKKSKVGHDISLKLRNCRIIKEVLFFLWCSTDHIDLYKSYPFHSC